MTIVSSESTPTYSSAEFFGDLNESLRPTTTPALAIQTYESLLNLFMTHTDPTNPYQNRLARLAGYPVVYAKLEELSDAA